MNLTMTMLKRVQLCVVSIMHEKLVQELSFMDFGDVTEAYTDHAHMETAKENEVHRDCNISKIYLVEVEVVDGHYI